MIFKTIKPGVNQKYFRTNPNQPCVNFFSPYANSTISVIPKSLAKSSRGTAYIFVLITCLVFLVQSVDVTFSDKRSLHLPRKSLHGLHHFAPRWISYLTSDPILFGFTHTFLQWKAVRHGEVSVF